MDPRFAIAERTYYWKDRFDTPLDSYLFDTIEHLRVISSGEHPIWRIVVADLLDTYFMRIFMGRIYHFKLSYGNPYSDKSKRQVDFEKHISMLEFTDARNYISKVCVESLNGRAWQAIQKLRIWQWQAFFKPKLIFALLILIPMKLILGLISRANGAGFALEMLGLFKSINEEECEAILAYWKKHPKEDWAILSFLNILIRPGMISKDMQARFEGFIYERQFERDDIHQQVLARLTKISSLALQKLNELVSTEESGNLNREALDSLIASAAINPDVMEYWISQSPRLERYYYSGIDDTFRKNLGAVDEESIKVVFHFARNGSESQSKFAETILKNTQQLTNAAQRYLYNCLKSDNQNERFLAASVINNLQIADRLLVEDVFDSLLEMGLGPDSLEVTNNAYQATNDFQQKVLGLLLEISKNRQDLVRRFLLALRDKWSSEFVGTVSWVFVDTQLTKEMIATFASKLQFGEIESCRKILMENKDKINPSKYSEVLEALESVQNNDMLSYILRGEGTETQQEFSKICLGYTFRVWHCLVAVNSKISSLTSTNYLILSSLLCLTNPNRNTWKSAPVSNYDRDSYVSICVDIGKAIEVINSLDNDDLVIDVLVNFSKMSNSDVDTVMRTLSYFPRSDQRLFEIIREGFTEAYTGREKHFPWQNMNRISRDEVSLVIKSILDRSAPTELLKNPHTVDAAGAEILIDALKRRKELAQDDVNELWLVIYAIKSLVHSSMINEDVINICKDILAPKVNMFNDSHALDERPYAAWTLSRVRPFRPDIYYFLKELVTSGPTQFTAYGHAVWTKVAAMIAISEIGSDITNNLSWAEREDIADVIIKYVTLPFQTDFNLFGGENVFPEKPSDSVYDAACLIVDTMRKHWAQTDYVVKDFID